MLDKLVGFTILGLIGFLVHGIATGPISVASMPNEFSPKTTLIYFGTDDCGSCMMFKRSGLKQVRASARRDGFKFVRRHISTVRKLGHDDAFGSYDPLYQAVAQKAGQHAVPMFGVVEDGKVIAAAIGNWPSMVRLAAKKVAN